tara:strand:- start:1637 stop:2308 length:672 start_codon:yes stop_codon:yes gene_type:complete
VRVIETELYKKATQFEGDILDYMNEPQFSQEALETDIRKQDYNLYPPKAPKKKNVRQLGIENRFDIRNRIQELGPNSVRQDTPEQKRERFLKRREKDRLQDQDYIDVSKQVQEEIEREMLQWMERTGNKPSNSLLEMVYKQKMKKYIKDKGAVPTFDRPVRRTASKKEAFYDPTMEDEKEDDSHLYYEFMHYLDRQIHDFAELKNVDPETLKELIDYENYKNC